MDLFERIWRERLLADPQLSALRARVKEKGEDWATAMLALRLAPEREIVRLLSRHTGYPGVELSKSIIPLTVVGLLPEDLVRQRRVLPVVDAHGGLVVAMADPDNRRLADEIGFSCGRKVLCHVAVPGLLASAIEGCARAKALGEKAWRGKEAWSFSPGPEGRASIVRAEPEGGQGEGELSMVVGAEVEPEKLEVVGLLDPAFDAPELPRRAPGGELARPDDARTTRKSGLGTGKVVLVVDDDPQMRVLEKKLLEPFGCALLESGDGKQALALVREARPDLVVLDGMLPGMHGFEVCRAIKGDPDLRRTAVLMISGEHTGWQVGVDISEVYGADGFFSKPFNFEHFGRAVRRLLLADSGEDAAAKARREAALAACREAASRAREGKLAQAIDLLRAATAKDPYSAEPHFYLGQLLERSGDPYRALASLQRAAELRPDLDLPLIQLGELYQKLGFRKTAREVLTRAAEMCQDGGQRAQLQEKAAKLEG